MQYIIYTRPMALHVRVSESEVSPVRNWKRFCGACVDYLMDNGYSRPYPPFVKLSEEQSRVFSSEYLGKPL